MVSKRISRREAISLGLLATASVALSSCDLSKILGTDKKSTEYNYGKPLIGIGGHRMNDTEISLLNSLNCHHARTTYYFQSFRVPDNDNEFAAKLDRIRAAGIKPLVVVHDFPDMTDRGIANSMSYLARKFPDTDFQPGNEWDLIDGHPYGNGKNNARLMQGVIEEVKSIDPLVKIVTMGLGVTLPGNVPQGIEADRMRLTRFAEDYLSSSGLLADAFCVHSYGFPLVDDFVERTIYTNESLRGKMPLWVTEFGIDDRIIQFYLGQKTAEEIDAIQAQQIVETLGALDGRVERAFIYQGWDNSKTGFGMIRDDESERPVCDGVRGFLRDY